MIYLLSSEGLEVMRVLVKHPILYGFDFDGTLAPISPERESVRVSRSMAEWLKELAKRVPCAVVSGRGLRDLAPRVDGMVPHLIGNHGMESPLTPPLTLAWAKGICAGWIRMLTGTLASQLSAARIELENKRYSVTLHYKADVEAKQVNPELTAFVNQLTPVPRLIFGKQSVNLLPPGKGGKGAAALALMQHLKQDGLFYVGDDETDEDVFQLRDGLALGVRVGKDANSQARYYVRHQSEIEEVIRFLVHRIDRTPESQPDPKTAVIGTQNET